MYLKNVILGRFSHWNNTAEPVCATLMKRAARIEHKHFACWVVAFISSAHNFLREMLFDDHPKGADVPSRLKSLSQESFLSLHTIFFVHHVAICRENLPGFERVTRELAPVLGTSNLALEAQIAGYDGLDALGSATHLYRQIARVLGLPERDLISIRMWCEAVVIIAKTAHECAPRMSSVIGGLRGADGEDEDD